ncbi:MAG: SusC/RagA family TonB-linked outer membrane protein [Bacteroidales bacterium]|jgi:TonB-linked SusC/RagA family outer membrane protein|nr:SusC/RagA family TonB-linked outer membrane protein [Bacteroidales bacterium]
MKKKKNTLCLAFVMLLGVNVAFSQRTITGTVIDDATRETLPLVSVMLKGTPTGTVTSLEGVFSINVPSSESVLVFSFLGYEPFELKANVAVPVTVRMRLAATTLEGVVITGMFERARESYTGSVSTIRSEELQTHRGQNLVQTLANIDPSINILSDNLVGSNPNALPDITIRGRSSLPLSVQEINEGQKHNLNTPLIVMDGFEISLQRLMDFNDQEIASINVLKDASATAIYGSRGANGVIVIATKQPVHGRLRINLRTSLDLDIPDLTTYDLLNADEKLQLEWDNGFYQSSHASTDLALKRIYYRRLRDVLEGNNTHWMSKPLRTGISHRHNLRLDGGSQEFRWSVGLANNRTSGVMKNSYRNNFNGQVTLQYNYKNLVFRNQAEIGNTKGVNSNYGAFRTYTRMNPYYRTHDENGLLVRDFITLEPNNFGGYGSSTEGNPLYNASLKSFDESKYQQLTNNFSIDWTIIKGLSLRGKFGLSAEKNATDRFVSPLHTSFMAPYFTSGDGILERGRYTYIPGEANNYDASATLSYSKTFKDKHQIYAGLDYSMLQRKSQTYVFDVVGFNNENLSSVGNAMRYPVGGKPSESENFTRSLGVTSNINYMYDNRYYADFSLRMEGSSQFGANNRFAPFYSIGGGWNLHREDFLKNHDVLSSLRFRLSYGQTGSQQFSAYQAMRLFRTYSNDRYGTWGGSFLSSLGNKNLSWQITDQFNAGTEVGVFNNRVTAQLDCYIKTTSNLLSNIEIPRATGFSHYITNIGEVKNTGFEASLGGSVFRNRAQNMVWTLNGKIAYNKDQITKLSEEIKRQTEEFLLQDVDVSTLFYEGHSQNALYVVRSLGIDPSTGREIFLNKHGEVVHQWLPSDKVYAGVQEPAYRGILSSMFRWQNLSVNFSFACHWGGIVYNSTLIDRVEVSRRSIAGQNVDRRVLTDRWSQPGDIAAFKKIPAANETDVPTRGSTRFVMNSRVFQMQTASIEYRFEQQWLRNAGIQNARLSMNMSDIFYLSSVKRERGLDYPFARRIGVALTLTF